MTNSQQFRFKRIADLNMTQNNNTYIHVIYLIPAILSIVVSIVPISGLFLMYKYRNEGFVRVRRPAFRYAIGIIWIFYGNGFIPYWCFSRYNSHINGNTKFYDGNEADKDNQIFLMIHAMVIYSTIIIKTLEQLRAFSEYKLASDTADWKKHLNPNFTTWVIRKWAIIHNNYLMATEGIIVFIIYSLPIIICVIFLDVSFYTACTVNIISSMIHSCTIVIWNHWVNIKNLYFINDMWLINDELRRGKNFLYLEGVIHMMNFFYIFKFEWFFNNNWNYMSIFICTIQVAICTWYFSTIHLSIYQNVKNPYHIRLKHKIENRVLSNSTSVNSTMNRDRGNSTKLSQIPGLRLITTTSKDKSSAGSSGSPPNGGSTAASVVASPKTKSKSIAPGKNSKNGKISGSIVDIFNSDKRDHNDSTTFDLFMTHLNDEFTIENGLFIIYLLQYQKFLIENNILKSFQDENQQAQLQQGNDHHHDDHDSGDATTKTDMNNRNLILKGRLKLPPNIPQSPLFEMKSNTKTVTHSKNRKSKKIIAKTGVVDEKETTDTSTNINTNGTEEIEIVTSPRAKDNANKNDNTNEDKVDKVDNTSNRNILSMIGRNIDLTVKILNAYVFIYEKFIRRDFAPFEINISSITREGITNWYNILNSIKSAAACAPQRNRTNGKTVPLNRGSLRSQFSLKRLNHSPADGAQFFDSYDLEKYVTYVETLEGAKQAQFDVDFIQMWQSMIQASREILALMNQSVSRYFKQQLGSIRI